MATDPPSLPWRTLRQETLALNPYWSYRRDEYVLPTGQTNQYYYVQTPGAVMVVPFLDEQTLLCVRQYRYLNGRESLEFPGGGQKADQEALLCAQTELQEETGYQARHWQSLGGFNPCKGLTSEWCTVFLCRELDLAPLVHSDPFEVTTAEAVSIVDFEKKVAGGEIWCGMTMAAWVLARSHAAFG